MRFFYTLSVVLLGSPILAGAQNQVSRPPITGIAQISVYTSSIQKARQFYGNLLGLPGKGIDPHTGSLLYRVNSLQAIQIDPLPKGVASHLESIAFSTSNVDQLRRYLLDKQVRVSDTVQTHRDGTRSFSLLDPEGHQVVFIEAGARPHPTVGSNEPDNQPVSTHILHAGFVVHDRAAEDHFFRDVLGFHQAWEGGKKDNQTDWVDMQVPDGNDWLEYMLHGPEPVSAMESGVLNHFALGVPNMHEAMDLLEQNGWQSSAREDAQIGRDGKWQLNLYDPDGTRVELMEFRPIQIPCCSPYSLPEEPK